MAPGAITGVVEVVDTGARDIEQHSVGGSTKITIDAAGSPIIVYQDGYTLELRLARQDGGSWTHEIGATGAMAMGFSMGVAWFKDQLIVSSGAVDRGKLQAHQIRSTVVK